MLHYLFCALVRPWFRCTRRCCPRSLCWRFREAAERVRRRFLRFASVVFQLGIPRVRLVRLCPGRTDMVVSLTARAVHKLKFLNGLLKWNRFYPALVFHFYVPTTSYTARRPSFGRGRRFSCHRRMPTQIICQTNLYDGYIRGLMSRTDARIRQPFIFFRVVQMKID